MKHHHYARAMTPAESPQLAAVAQRTAHRTHAAHMLSGHIEGRLLHLLVKLTQPRLLVEVGTLTGYATLCMAEAMPDDARLITCERDPRVARLARQHFDTSPWHDRIKLCVGPARETLVTLDEPIGFAYVDADKRAYSEYYELLLQRMTAGAVMVLDNMWMKGTVLDPTDRRGAALDTLNRDIVRDTRVENVFLPFGDGVQVLRKR